MACIVKHRLERRKLGARQSAMNIRRSRSVPSVLKSTGTPLSRPTVTACPKPLRTGRGVARLQPILPSSVSKELVQSRGKSGSIRLCLTAALGTWLQARATQQHGAPTRPARRCGKRSEGVHVRGGEGRLQFRRSSGHQPREAPDRSAYACAF